VAVPTLGARVVSLVDLRSGREWLVQGEPPAGGEPDAWARDEAVFGGREAFGWDECLPTVAPCPDPLAPDGPPLRDHGDAWGRETEVVAADGVLRATWTSQRWPFTLERSVTLDGATVVARYRLAADGDRPLPMLWSMHALLALEPGSRLLVEPAITANLTHGAGWETSPGPVAWPGSGSARFDLVEGADAGRAAKLYLDATTLDRVAARTPDGAELRFSWDRERAPTLGIWLDDGGWPEDEPREQVALEPTTAPHDDLAGAIASGTTLTVEPGEPVEWSVRLELVTPPA
jgi:galactose mutarotase-like enzyme